MRESDALVRKTKELYAPLNGIHRTNELARHNWTRIVRQYYLQIQWPFCFGEHRCNAWLSVHIVIQNGHQFSKLFLRPALSHRSNIVKSF